MPKVILSPVWLAVLAALSTGCPAREPDRNPGACARGPLASEVDGACEWLAQGRCYASPEAACRCICASDRMCGPVAGSNEVTCEWDTPVVGHSGDSANAPACAGGICVPKPPSGWQGPVVYYEGNAIAPSCPSTYPVVVLTAKSGVEAGQAQCGLCACAAPTGVTCKAKASFFDGLACSGDGCWGGWPGVCNGDPLAVDSACKPQNLCWSQSSTDKPRSAAFTQVEVAGGMCAPFAQSGILKGTPSYTTNAHVCGGQTADPAGCGASTMCVPATPPGFAQETCVFRSGDAACPASGWTNRHVFYTGEIVDARACSPCSCGPPAGTCVGAKLELYTDPACTQELDTISVAELAGCTNIKSDSFPIAAPGCNGVGGDSRSMRIVGGSPAAATCAPSGGVVTGAATPTGPVTLCCL